MITIDELLEHEEIKLLKYRYMRALDTQDWPLMESLFVNDARTWYSNGKHTHDGRDNIMNFFRTQVKPNLISSHIVVHPEIKLTGKTTANGVWRLQDTIHYVDENGAHGNEVQAAAYYYDEYVKTDDGWKIKSTGYVRIFEKIQAPGQVGKVLNVDPQRGLRH